MKNEWIATLGLTREDCNDKKFVDYMLSEIDAELDSFLSAYNREDVMKDIWKWEETDDPIYNATEKIKSFLKRTYAGNSIKLEFKDLVGKCNESWNLKIKLKSYKNCICGSFVITVPLKVGGPVIYDEKYKFNFSYNVITADK